MQGTHRWISKAVDSTLMIGAGTLLLYLAASNYLKGYLSYFGANADWFSPSLFQLVSFCNLPILFTLLLTTLYFFLSRPRFFTWGFHIFLYVLWVVMLALVYFFGLGDEPKMPITTKGIFPTVATCILLILMPAFVMVVEWFARRRAAKITSKGPVSEEQAIREERTFHALNTGTFLFTLYLLTSFAYRIGLANASLDFVGILHAERSIPTTEVHVALIFTDGTSTLRAFFSGPEWTFQYHNPVAQVPLNLRSSQPIPLQLLSTTAPANKAKSTMSP